MTTSPNPRRMKRSPLSWANREAERASRIAARNDAFRKNFGRLVVSARLHELGSEFVDRAVEATKAFDRFSPENDPSGWRDFGEFTLDGVELFWKIDTYIDGYTPVGTVDPLDPEASQLLTLMLAEEW